MGWEPFDPSWRIEQLTSLLKRAPAAVVVTGLDGQVRLWNDGAVAMFGWTADEAIGRPVADLLVPEGLGVAAAAMQAVIEGRQWQGILPVRHRDGTRLDVDLVNAPLTDADGDRVGVLGLSVVASGARWRRLVEHATDALTLHDPTGAFLYASPAFGDLLGLSTAELVGRTPYDLFHPDELDELAALHEDLLAGSGPRVAQYRLRRSDGTYLWVEGALRWDATEGLLVAQVRSIRARRSLLQVLEHERTLTARLQDLQDQQRQFLTTVAHRVRTPMTAILGFSRVLAQQLPPDADGHLRNLVARLNANVDELTQLIEDVTHSDLLTRQVHPVRRQPVDLHELVADVVAERATTGGAITVGVPSGTRVFADPLLLRQALSALVHNAVVHTPIGTPCQIRADLQPAHADLIVEDHGPGVPEHLRTRIWEPFRHGSDDPADPGMGLGLSMVAQVAAAHGGHAWVEDGPAGGASFRVRIPQRGRPTTP